VGVKPAVVVGGARVFQGDCREVLKGLPDNSVDSIVTDPPYGLNFMGKEWDNPGRMLGQMATGHEQRGAYAYGGSHSRGYADNDSLGFQLWATEWAVQCLRVLKPGGHILAFGGSRTWHRLAVAVEDAGFEIRDNIAWIYGSGFPKSLDVSKAIDKNLGVEREKIRVDASEVRNPKATGGGRDGLEGATRPWIEKALEVGFHEKDSDTPASPKAKHWEGWGTALKPAHEPVVVGRKPLVGTVAENVLAWGVGGLNIDGSRIGSDGGTKGAVNPDVSKRISSADFATGRGSEPIAAGRWPANVIFDEVTAGLLDEQSGVSKSPVPYVQASESVGIYGAEKQHDRPSTHHGDKGGASRFFYVAKASKRDRNEGLEELEARENADWPQNLDGNDKRGATPRQNFHPTVKPTALMRYLIKLVTPPGGTVLDPFTGSGSTGKAALLDGFQFVGIELTEEYLPIIEGRLKWANEKVDEDDTLF
jgi:site-specific DNA-methyltransferase (adenine-specific)